MPGTGDAVNRRTGAIHVRSGETFLYFAKFTASGKKLQALLREAQPAE